MQSKYIVFDRLFAVVFGETMIHAQVADAILRNGEYTRVTGAGFVNIVVDLKDYHLDVRPYGESISLNVAVDTVNDASALRRALNIPERSSRT